MKPMSIRMKITLWFSGALILVVVLTYFVVLGVSNAVIQKTIRDSLIETVEHNVDEVEFFESIAEMDLSGDVDYFLHWGQGYLEVDDDFLDEVNQVYTALYQWDGTLVYGENPIARETADIAFVDASIQRLEVDGTLYYIFDRSLTQDGLEGLWLRGVVSEIQGEVQMTSIARTSLILLPTLVIIAIVGGYLIARRVLSPIQEISESAARIRQGGDLAQRIEIGKGGDELHQLADSFNQMFQRLDQAFRNERQFTSDASHELRTPMSVIMAQCEMSLDGPQSQEEYHQALEVIYRQSRKMSRLINDMLDFTRLEQGAERYAMEKVDLTALVNDVSADMALLREKDIDLQWEAEDGVTMTGNRQLLARLLTNLISNAYRYGRQGGHIQVSLRTRKEQILLQVQDDGIGIAPEDQSRIFQRFYQADASRSGEGTGLGLSMVLEIARFHGGQVSLESQPGVGSTFVCTFPG